MKKNTADIFMWLRLILAALVGAMIAHLMLHESTGLHDVFWSGTLTFLIGILIYGRRLHRNLQASTRHLQNVLNTMEDGFWLVDRNARIIEANRASAAMLGYGVNEIQGSYIEQYEAARNPVEIKAQIDSIVHNIHERFDTRLKTRSGRILDIEVSCSYDREMDRIVASFRDISERKLVEADIRELSELNQMIIDQSESGIMVHKATGECIVANEAAARIVGTSLATLVEHNFRKSRSWRESGELGLADAALRTGNLQIHNMKMRTIYGKDIWCLGYLSRLSIKGEPYLLTMFADIMPIKQAEESMRLAKENAENTLNRAIAAEERVVSASEEVQRHFGQELHDGLGQKLTGAALLCKVLEGRLAALGLPEANDASRLVAQLNDAVSEARGIARGLFPVEFEKHGLIDALQKLADKVPNFSGMACTFDWDQQPALTDEKAFNLYRIAQEAVNNAVKHSHGEEIVISLQCGSPGQVRLSISDNGSSLEQYGSSLLERDGIGLQVMKFRARLIGAELSINADPATGTEIVATLPN